MSSHRPEILDHPMYQLLRTDKVAEFNRRKVHGEEFDFRGADFRSLNLREMDVDGVDFSDAYFRQTDLRGLDMSTCNLEGASIHGARISGVLFPAELSADEIRLSLDHGTRLRYNT